MPPHDVVLTALLICANCMTLPFSQMNHHPEWFNVYNRVDVTFTTHDCAGVSQNDFDAAAFFDTAFAARQRK